MSVHRRVAAVLVVLLALAAPLAATPAAAAPTGPSAAGAAVKYYVVTATDEASATPLEDIARRLLGDAARSGEIYDLNTARTQADGARLTDRHQVRAGWTLVLPWDAAGTGVRIGPLPDPGASSAASPAPGGPAPGTGAPTQPPRTGGCAATAPATATTSRWAQLRMAPEHAWNTTRGEGQVVAVVDSGVDGTLPEFAGHVSAGTDVVTGSGRGDTDCLGTGTAMASLIVAQPGVGHDLTGMAPGATVLPVRVATTGGGARPDDAAAGIAVAVSAGATVIALGPVVDTGSPAVAAAIVQAASHGIVVVAAAPSTPAPGSGTPAGQAEAVSLRVGGADLTGAPLTGYRAGGVDVLAPGAQVAALGIAGTGLVVADGTHYAVALVAGVAALVRAAHPELTGAQVISRVERTAEPPATGDRPGPALGWGMVDPGSAVNAQLSGEEPVSVPASAPAARPVPGSGVRIAAVAVVIGVAIFAALLVVARMHQMARPRTAGRPVLEGPVLEGEDR